MNRHIESNELFFDDIIAEKILSERLEYATEAIHPSLGYEVQLEGVQPQNPITWGALETYFDTLLDIKSGARLTLDYNVESDKLVLKEFEVNATSQDGPVFIRRTEHGYVPIQTIANSEFIYGLNDEDGGLIELAVQKNDLIKPEFGDRILESFGITDIPQNESDEYQMWLSQTLGSTLAWRLSETMTVPLSFTPDATQSVVLKKETVVGQDTQDFFVTRSLTETITQQDPQGEGTIVNASILELSGDIEESLLRHYLTESHYNPDPEPLFADDELVVEEKKQVVAIHEAEFSRLNKKLEDIILLKHELS